MSACTDRKPRWRRRIERAAQDPYAIVMHAVGDRTVGGNSVPLTWRHRNIDHRTTDYLGKLQGSFLNVGADNDAFGIVIRRYEGDPADAFTWHEWKHVYLDLNRREARSLVWVLVKWFAADWFGTRRRIYYWALTKHLDRWREHRKPAA